MSLAANLPLVTKVYFPRTLLPLAAVIVPMVDFLVGLPVLLALMWYYDTWPGGVEVLLAPLFMAPRGRDGARPRALPLGAQRPLPRRPLHDPRLPAGAAAALGRDVRGPVDPDEVAVDARLQPDDRRHHGMALGGARRAPPDLGQAALGVRVGVVLFVVGLAVFRSSEPRFADTI